MRPLGLALLALSVGIVTVSVVMALVWLFKDPVRGPLVASGLTVVVVLLIRSSIKSWWRQ